MKMSIMNRIGTGKGQSQIKQRLGFHNQPRKFENDSVSTVTDLKGQDARLKLIRKKRLNLKDARDKLAEIAKGGDARDKLNKLKATQKTFSKPPVNAAQQKVNQARINKANSLQVKTFNNMTKGNLNGINTKPSMKKVINSISGLKGKTQIQAGSLRRTVSGGSKVVGSIKSKPTATIVKKAPTKSTGDRFHPLPNNPNVVTIRNDRIQSTRPTSSVSKTQSFPRSSRPQQKGKNFFQSSTPATSRNSLSTRNSYPNQSQTKSFKGNVWDFNQNPYPMVDEIKPTRLKITTPNNYMNYNNMMEENWEMQTASRMPAFKRTMYNQGYDDYAPTLPKKQAILSANIISRLEQACNQPTPGFKVMVTNLHPVVTVEDVEELFRNIGPIRYARMVRDGMAEVIFETEIDAYRSVDVYHNRQLDGQAMNVNVVSKNSYVEPQPQPQPQLQPEPPRYSTHRSDYNPFSQPPSRRSYSSDVHSNSRMGSMPTKSVLRTAAGSFNGGHDAGISSITGRRYQKVDVSPDIGAIHHALFSGKNSNPNNNLQVYIKLPKSHIRGSK